MTEMLETYLGGSKLAHITEGVWVYRLCLMVEKLAGWQDHLDRDPIETDVLKTYPDFANLLTYQEEDPNGNGPFSYLNSLPKLDAVSADPWFDIWQPFPKSP